MQLVSDLQFSVHLGLVMGLGLGLGLGGSAYAWVAGTALARAAHGAADSTSGCACRLTSRRAGRGSTLGIARTTGHCRAHSKCGDYGQQEEV